MRGGRWKARAERAGGGEAQGWRQRRAAYGERDECRRVRLHTLLRDVDDEVSHGGSRVRVVGAEPGDEIGLAQGRRSGNSSCGCGSDFRGTVCGATGSGSGGSSSGGGCWNHIQSVQPLQKCDRKTLRDRKRLQPCDVTHCERIEIRYVAGVRQELQQAGQPLVADHAATVLREDVDELVVCDDERSAVSGAVVSDGEGVCHLVRGNAMRIEEERGNAKLISLREIYIGRRDSAK